MRNAKDAHSNELKKLDQEKTKREVDHLEYSKLTLNSHNEKVGNLLNDHRNE